MGRTLNVSVCIVMMMLAASIHGKVLKGNLIESSSWAFLADFCFDTQGMGNATWTIYTDTNVDNSKLMMVFYDDEASSWPSVYPNTNGYTCEELVSKAKGYQYISPGVQQQEEFLDFARPHYWYVALANCGSSIQVQYNIQFINAGGEWSRQFSFDEQGLPQMYLFFWLVFTIGLAAHLKGVWTLRQTGAFHPIVRLLTSAITLEATSLFFTFIHYAVYISNGAGAPGLKGLGDILNMASQLVFMLLLILLAKGWAITTPHINDRKPLTIGFCVFLLAYISMFIWQNVGRDPASTIYVYESAPGIIILVLRTLLMLYFLFCGRQSYQQAENTDEKRKFFVIFSAAYTVWFLALPFIVLLAVGFAAWYRFKVVTGLYLCINTLGLFGLAFLLWPSRAAVYFNIAKTDSLLQGTTSSPYDTL